MQKPHPTPAGWGFFRINVSKAADLVVTEAALDPAAELDGSDPAVVNQDLADCRSDECPRDLWRNLAEVVAVVDVVVFQELLGHDEVAGFGDKVLRVADAAALGCLQLRDPPLGGLDIQEDLLAFHDILSLGEITAVEQIEGSQLAEGVVILPLPLPEHFQFGDHCRLFCGDHGRTVFHPRLPAQQQGVELFERVPVDCRDIRESLPFEELFLKLVQGGPLPDPPVCPDNVGDEVEDERAEGYV